MNVELVIHLDSADDQAVWWAESDDVPGFSASADSLVELRRRAHAAIGEIVGEPARIRERLVGVALESERPTIVALIDA